MITDKYLIRELNEALVLKTIIEHQPLSRSNISSRSGLNKASVSSIIASLLEKDLVKETGIGNAGANGGRKPIFVSFNAKAGFALAIDVGYNYIHGTVAYLDGSFFHSQKKRVFINQTNVIEAIQNMVALLTQDLPQTSHHIVGLCLAIHGIVLDHQVLFTPSYDLHMINLHEQLSQLFEFPIYLENEANLAALGDYSFTHFFKNIVSISIHSGIGAGIIHDGQLQTGAHGQAGEIGHTTLYPNGISCPCGNQGCLEKYASNKSIYDEYEKLMQLDNVDSDVIVKAIRQGEPLVLELMDKKLRELAVGINNLTMLHDPELIIINSSIFHKHPELIAQLARYVQSKFAQNINLSISPLGENATLQGGIAKVIMSFLNLQELKLIHLR